MIEDPGSGEDSTPTPNKIGKEKQKAKTENKRKVVRLVCI